MWSKRLKDKKFRLGLKNAEQKNLAIYFLLRHAGLEGGLKIFILRKFLRFNKRNFLSQPKNRCVFSLRSRSPLRFFRLSRIIFRSAASSGLLLGVKKSSW